MRWTSANDLEISQDRIEKLRKADFSFGFRPVTVEVEAVHGTGKLSMKSTRNATEAPVQPAGRIRAFFQDLLKAA